MVGTQVTGKRLGISAWVGSDARARRARGFDMTIHYRDPPPAGRAEEGAIFHPTPEELLPHCDFLTLHCVAPSVDCQAAERCGASRLLPDGAIVVNASRGAVIDDDALIAALKSGKLTAAGLDVYNNEPDIHPRNIGSYPTISGCRTSAAPLKETRDARGRATRESGCPSSPGANPGIGSPERSATIVECQAAKRPRPPDPPK